MTQPARCDVMIIGGGQAGIPLAFALAKTGKRVMVAERKDLGGSCVNFGCTPTKAAIASAKVAHLARRGADYGLRMSGLEIDFAAVIARARNVAAASRTSLEAQFRASSNPRLVRGHGRLDGREGSGLVVRVADETIIADHVVIDTGTRSAIPPIAGLDRVKFIHAGNWLTLTELPPHVAMIGGGAIGLEMAQFYCRVGSRVTVIESADRVAGHEDPDIAHALQRELERAGVVFRLNTAVRRVDARDGGVEVTLGDAVPLRASHLFVATGRKPNTDDLGLDTVGVAATRGIIAVDERLATNVAGVWAAGDVRGGPQFTHTAWDDHRVLVSQIAGDGARTTRRVVPYAIFTDPELGRVGMTQSQAERAGHAVRIGRFEMSHSGKAAEIGESEGLIKVMVDAGSNEVLGAAVLAANGGELVHGFVDLMNARAPYTVLRDAVYIHPTLFEAVQGAVLALG